MKTVRGWLALWLGLTFFWINTSIAEATPFLSGWSLLSFAFFVAAVVTLRWAVHLDDRLAPTPGGTHD